MSTRSVNIPQDVMELDNTRFFEFIKFYSGEKLATLLEIQDITNVECLLICNDPFEILSFDSDELLELKKKTCIKLNDNSFVVLPGLKSKMELLKNALTKKRNELKKEASKILPHTIVATDTSSSNSSSLKISSSSTASSETEGALKRHVIHLVDEWCDKIKTDKNQPGFQLKEGADYYITVSVISNKVIISCQCGTKSTLGQKDNNFILSNYIRHLTNANPCLIIQEKMKSIGKNTTLNVMSNLNNTTTPLDSTTDGGPSIETLLSKRKKTQALQTPLRKKKKTI